jgi:hypothetical protein
MLAVVAVLYSQTSAGCHRLGAGMLAFGQCRAGENSGTAGCFSLFCF